MHRGRFGEESEGREEMGGGGEEERGRDERNSESLTCTTGPSSW